MVRVLNLIERFAPLDTSVLIQGETGTGKELVARALHELSPRAAKPLVVIDCGSMPDSILESELFGHERGAFTGADRAYGGRVQAAAGGTLLLDEVNAISLPMQAKLLRFIEDRAFYRLGQPTPIAVDVRVLSASNVPFEELIATGRIRADFFYRLNVLRIDVPPLRERQEDIPLLVTKFLASDRLARGYGVVAVAAEVMDHLSAMPFPGNVRELFNLLRRAVALAGEGPVLRSLPLPANRSSSPPGARPTAERPCPATFRSWVREREREYLADLLSRYPTTAQQAAASGLPQRTLYRKIRRLGLQGGTRISQASRSELQSVS